MTICVHCAPTCLCVLLNSTARLLHSSSQGPVTALAVGRHPAAPQHALLFAGSKDGTVSVWNAEDGSRLQVLPSVHCLGTTRRRGGSASGTGVLQPCLLMKIAVKGEQKKAQPIIHTTKQQ